MITIIILSSVVQFIISWLIMRKLVKNDIINGYDANDEILTTVCSLIPIIGAIIPLLLIGVIIKLIMKKNNFSSKFFMIKGW